MTSSEILVTQKEKSNLELQTIDVDRKLQTDERIGDLQEINFYFKELKFDREKAATLRMTTEMNVVLMQFCLQGGCTYKSSSGKKSISFKSSEYNILYIPNGDYNVKSVSTTTNLLNIYIEEEFFFRQVPKDHKAFTHKNAATFGTLFPKNLYINPRLTNIITEINTCEFEGHLKMLYLKAKIIELFTLQLSQSTAEQSIELKVDEIEKMKEVKELIEQNLAMSYSLAYLAKVAGTNEQYLKKHFKILHGHTVFGYMLACKMQKAKDMLVTGKFKIAEIAESVGYQHATHFTSAFKKFFGYLPKMLKTKFLLGSYFSFNLELELLEVLIAI